MALNLSRLEVMMLYIIGHVRFVQCMFQRVDFGTVAFVDGGSVGHSVITD